MSYPLIASRLYTQPWCILPEVHGSISQQFRSRCGLTPRNDADDPVGSGWRNPWTGQVEYDHPQIQAVGGVALAHISGIIGKHLSQMEMQCGGYDLSCFDDQMRNVANDPSIHTLVIDFNTPGGVAIGVGAAARSIRAVSAAGKKVIGYTSYQCCSAGYWLASACDEFHAEASAYVGSISTFIAAVDSHRAWEIEGFELKLFRTGELKAIGASGKQWTPEEEAFLQQQTENVDRDFKDFVGSRRGLTDAEMNGGFWQAKSAPAGLVDSTAFDSLTALIESVYTSI